MDASSSQGPFMLAALIFVLLNSLISEPEVKQKAHALKDNITNTQVVLKEITPDTEAGLILKN